MVDSIKNKSQHIAGFDCLFGKFFFEFIASSGVEMAFKLQILVLMEINKNIFFIFFEDDSLLIKVKHFSFKYTPSHFYFHRLSD